MSERFASARSAVRWILVVLASLTGLLGIVWLTGALLPERHVAGTRAAYGQPAESLFAVITEVEAHPAWRSGVSSVEILRGVPLRWREVGEHGPITYAAEVVDPPTRFVARIDDPAQPFGRTWSWRLQPDERGGSVVSITEVGEIHHPLFRFFARFVFGCHGAQEAYLRSLGERFGETSKIERVDLGMAESRVRLAARGDPPSSVGRTDPGPDPRETVAHASRIEGVSAAEEIRHVVTSAYIDGLHRNGSRDSIRAGFHLSFVMQVLGGDSISSVSIEEWIARLPDPGTPPDHTVSHRIPDVGISGRAAVARVEVMFDDRLVFIDYMSLYEFEDGWRIVTKIFNAELAEEEGRGPPVADRRSAFSDGRSSARSR